MQDCNSVQGPKPYIELKEARWQFCFLHCKLITTCHASYDMLRSAVANPAGRVKAHMPNLDMLQCYDMLQTLITRRTGIFGVFERFSCVCGLVPRKSTAGEGSRKHRRHIV